MNFFLKIFIAVVLLVVYSAGLIWYLKKDPDKLAYVVTGKVFEKYDGTQEIKQRLLKEEEQQKKVLDSLLLEIKISETSIKNEQKVLKMKDSYNQLLEQYVHVNQKKSKHLEEAIWNQINQYIGEYGRERGYKVILGATGNGSLMFADSSYNRTDEIIDFLNKKYKGE